VKTTDVKIWNIQEKTDRKKPSWEVRWKTANRRHAVVRRTKALAQTFWSDLRQAAKNGEEFDVESGLPDSMTEKEPEPEPEPPRTFLALAQEFVTKRWPHAAPKTRDSMTDALATVIPALAKQEVPGRPSPKDLRSALRRYILLPADKRPEPAAQFTDAAKWLEAASLPVPDLSQAKVIRSALDALTVNLDGTKSSANTISRKRAVLHSILEYAVEGEELPSNPLHKISWTPPKTTQTVDPRVVVNQKQARSLLDAVTRAGGRGRGERLAAMFACMYYAAMRPAEVVALHKADCLLPASGWGSITLARSRPEVNIQWSDTGATHEERSLKHRAATDVRVVPIPPVLVAILVAHIAKFGVADDGRLFRTERGRPVGSTAYTEVWQQARALALTPEQVASPLARRPYDLRHAAVSLWLNAGVSPTEIAKRAGHSVEVLLRVYAKCVDGQEEITNHRIEEILGPVPSRETDQDQERPQAS
jgi:integrase